MKSEIETKIKEYENFIEEKLKKDLKEIEVLLLAKSNEYKEWKEVKNVIAGIKEFKEKDRDMQVNFNIDSNVSSFATITDYESVYVDVGLGCILEMNREEGDKYSDIRLKLIKREIDHLSKMAVNVKVHIKMVLLAISELHTSIKS